MVTIKIDGRKISVQEGSNILANARNLKIDIPTLCYHKDLASFGACRLCTVEVKVNGTWQLAASCTTPVSAGMEVRTDSVKVRESRKAAAELLYWRYPKTEAVRDVARKLGVAVTDEKGTGHDCILCGLCVRTCREIVGVSALAFNDRGKDRELENPEIVFDAAACIGCGSCAFVCPTGFVAMEAAGDKRIIWNKVFKMTRCPKCGRYFAPEDQLKYISKTTGVAMSELSVCVDCR